MSMHRLSALALFVFLFVPLGTTSEAPGAGHVIAISVDGMASTYVEPMLLDGQLPNLKRIIDGGARTWNARTDADYAVTLPNHVCMVTGRGILGEHGHHWVGNGDPGKGETLATNRGHYVHSIFDVAHDHGHRTAMWSGKTKFVLFDVSYNEEHGPPDTVGEDNGRDKLDHSHVDGSLTTEQIVESFISEMSRDPIGLAFVHFADPDTAGHRHGWGTARYRDSIIAVDDALGRILKLIGEDPRLDGRTAIIITADHGGRSKSHGHVGDLRDTMIPFLVWGPGVAKGDLYKMNPETRINPGPAPQVPYGEPGQPIRNGDLGNLAMHLLGLDPIPGSTINAKQDLQVSTPPPSKPASVPAEE